MVYSSNYLKNCRSRLLLPLLGPFHSHSLTLSTIIGHTYNKDFEPDPIREFSKNPVRIRYGSYFQSLPKIILG